MRSWDALTRAELAGARSGSGRPESGKKALPRPLEWFWRGCGEVWWARWLHNASGALFIGGRGRCRGRSISGEGLRRGRGRTGSLGGWASSVRSTGSIPCLSLIVTGLLRCFNGTAHHGLVGGRERALRYSGHGDGSAARSEREEGHAEATGGLDGAERRRVAGLIPVGRHGRYCRRCTRRRRRDSSAPTPTSSQPTMRRTDKKREQCTSGQASHWRDGRRRLKKRH